MINKIEVESWWDNDYMYITKDDGDIHIRSVNDKGGDEVSTSIFIDYETAKTLIKMIDKMIKE